MPEYPEIEALRRALDEPVAANPVERAGPAHVATLKTFEPPLRCARGPAPRRSTPPGQAPALPDRGRRARAPRPSDDRRPAATRRAGRQGAEDAGLPAALRGRRAHSCSPRPARRSAPGSASTRRRRWRRSSPTSGRRRTASAPTGSARSSPRSRAGCIRCCVTSGPSPASAGPGRTRSSTAPGSRPTRSRPSSSPDEVERLAEAVDAELERGLELRERGVARRKDLPGAQPARTAVPAVRDPARTGRLRGAHDLLLPELPDAGPCPQGPHGSRDC